MADDSMDRIIDLKNDKSITIKQKTAGDVGCVVWDAALVLLHYLETEHFEESIGCLGLANKNVVELGSGTGVVGITAGVHKAQVTVTDLESFVPLMDENISRNHLQQNVRAVTYKWGTDPSSLGVPPHPNLILFSDCIYYKEAVQPLVTTLKEICDEETNVVCSYEERTLGDNATSLELFLELIKKDFTVTEVPLEEMDSTYRSEDIHILHMRKISR